MKTIFNMAMRKATKLAKSQHVIEATRVIQHALGGLNRDRQAHKWVDAELTKKHRDLGERPEPAAALHAGMTYSPQAPDHAKPLGKVLASLQRVNRQPPFGKPAISPPVPAGARYESKTFSCAAGARDYKVYVPATAYRGKRPLLVMLHGCTQNPDDFALGTGMNILAEEHGFIAAYPGQTAAANSSVCWNWFNLKDQSRGEGEPAIIAGITQAMISDYEIDPRRVYIAGLSAGGAMALVMALSYPELYAAAGVHSGLPYGLARDLPSAFAAMRGQPMPMHAGSGKARKKHPQPDVRTIVFHGASDHTVSPSNGQLIVAQARATLRNSTQELQMGRSGTRAYTRTLIKDERGSVHLEYWAITGLAHAWSGGRPEGSYTDPHGPDASREMLRFFLSDGKAKDTHPLQ
ncbi:MAG TPA: PHB depolymerase family esterase [Methylocella sp.]|jgi:poly(hydroxyalkanoate) depolymerase family esterase